MNRLGLRYRRPYKQTEDSRRVCALALDGLPADQIKSHLPHLKHVAIYDIVYRNHIPLTPMPPGRLSSAKWSAEEDELLLDGDSNQQTAESIAQRLSGRSVFSVETRMKVLRTYGATRMGTRRGQWQKEEEDLLNQLYNKKTPYKDIAQKLNRSYLSILRRINISRHDGSRDSSAGLLQTSFSNRSERLGPVTVGKTFATRSRSYSSFDAKPADPAKSPRRHEWCDTEIDLLRQLHAEGRPLAEFRELLPNRSFFGINTKRRRLGLQAIPARLHRQDEWTDAETEILHQAFEEGKSLEECCELFPNRTIKAIGNKRNRLGLKTRSGVKQSEEKRRICALASEGLSVAQIKAEFPQRTYYFIHDLIYRNRLAYSRKRPQKGRPKGIPWSAEEDGIVLNVVSDKQTVASVAKLLPQRSITAIESRVKGLQLYGPTRFATRRGPWQDDEVDLLAEMYRSKIAYKDIALRLGRSYSAVQHRIASLRQESIRPRPETP